MPVATTHLVLFIFSEQRHVLDVLFLNFHFAAPGWVTVMMSTTGVAEISSGERGVNTGDQARQGEKKEATQEEKSGVTGI